MPDTQPKPTAAEVVVAVVSRHRHCKPAEPEPLTPGWTARHTGMMAEQMLAAAGYPTTAEALIQHDEDVLRDHPALPTPEHDAQVLRDAAAWLGHAKGCHPDPDRDPYYGCECRASLLYARADRIEGGDPT